MSYEILIMSNWPAVLFQILNKYCLLIEDVERRIELAKKFNCNDTLIEVKY